MILVIDNYDSFVHNLARHFVLLGRVCRVIRNDALSPSEIFGLAPEAIVLSPGPCTPDRAGLTLDLVRQAAGRMPVLGVCLGHQAIAQAFGGKVVRAKRPLHGHDAPIRHDGSALFSGISNPFMAGRYHSLAVDLDAARDLTATAWSEEGEVMALAHRVLPIFGVQFHPESILTPAGLTVLANFLGEADRYPRAAKGTA